LEHDRVQQKLRGEIMEKKQAKRWLARKLKLCAILCVGALTANPPVGDLQAGEFVPAGIYASTSPAVVLVEGNAPDGGSLGTGSIIDPKGYVLTNAHVILDKQSKAPYPALWIYLKPKRVTGNMKTDLGHRIKASAVAYDADLDLALLKVTPSSVPLPVLPMGDPDQIAIGTPVLAIGHPEQGGLWTLTTGVISAEWENFQRIPGKHVFQTETGLNRGNSGGPLINGAGHQIGVNTSIARKSKDGLAITSISFSIKSSVVKDWVARQGIELAYALIPSPTEFKPSQTASVGESATSSTPEPDDKAPSVKMEAPPQPTGVLENQPEAKPVTGAGLPPVRPFNLDRLMKSLAEVEQDLETQLEEMEAEVRKRR
jgi:serine protease Do